MTAQELILNIAVNLGRLSRWASEGKTSRIDQFLAETQEYLTELEKASKNEQFMHTLDSFRNNFKKLKDNPKRDELWAEDALTWANILTHRAKLA